MQQHLNDAERARDVALLEVKMMQYPPPTRRGGDRDEHQRGRYEYRAERRRSPRRMIRCETRYADRGACTYWVSDQ